MPRLFCERIFFHMEDFIKHRLHLKTIKVLITVQIKLDAHQ